MLSRPSDIRIYRGPHISMKCQTDFAMITCINVCDQSCKDCTCSYYWVKHIDGTVALITLRYTRYLR